MKRFLTILWVLLLVLALVACAKQESIYTVSKNGTEFRVDTEQKTIWDGLYTYRYDLSGDASSFRVTITYPNGASYWYSQSDGTGYGSWDDGYEESTYASGTTLVDIIEPTATKTVNIGKIVAALLLAAIGIFDIVSPARAWYVGYGWRFKDAEPSDAALAFGRIGGVISIIAGGILLFS